jgi:peptidoglycan/xylan/chitin deacetylase (PgdA/CDA1 family)
VKTPRVLDKLEKYKIPATFFMIGQLVNDDTKSVIDRIVSMRCEIGNHSWSTDGMAEMPRDAIRKSIMDTSAAIRNYSGLEPAFFRPPNLSVSDTLYASVNLPFASGIVGMDWPSCNTSAEDRARNVLKDMKDGAIILLHDNQPDPHPTPEALELIIPELKKQGYEFVTLSEIFSRKGVKADSRKGDMWVFVE